MEQKEFLRIGRTWFFIYVVTAGVTAGWLMGNVTFEQWWQTVVALGGTGGFKSGLQKVGEGLGKKNGG